MGLLLVVPGSVTNIIVSRKLMSSRFPPCFHTVYSFLLAVLCEGMSYSQSKVRHSSVLQSKPKVRKVIMTLLYGLQQCLGWALMLISMMFSLELFACVVVGVLVGKLIFPTEQLQNQYSPSRGQQGRGASDRSTTTEGQPRRQRSTDDASHDLAVEDGTTSPRQGERLGSPAVRRRRR